MNPETILQTIADQLFMKATSATGKIHIVLVNNNFEIVSSETYKEPVRPIATYKCDDIRKGLTITQWEQLHRKVVRALKDKS
jgi:hypothetical protein